MTQTNTRFLSFEEYLSYDDGTDRLYELFNGELIEVPPESGKNVGIATFLLLKFAEHWGYLHVRGHGLELEVWGEPKNRYPDLTLLRPEHISLLRHRNTIRLSMAPPLLVVEVVSPGELQRDRDYIAKRRQYEERGIPEYWIVDPQLQQITGLVLQGAGYSEGSIYRECDRLRSPALSELGLTADQILTAGS